MICQKVWPLARLLPAPLRLQAVPGWHSPDGPRLPLSDWRRPVAEPPPSVPRWSAVARRLHCATARPLLSMRHSWLRPREPILRSCRQLPRFGRGRTNLARETIRARNILLASACFSSPRTIWQNGTLATGHSKGRRTKNSASMSDDEFVSRYEKRTTPPACPFITPKPSCQASFF